MFFSIIVPIYHVEDYLVDCINSVINQKFNDYELILVDDGGDDKCPEICDEFSKKFPDKIKVIHKANGGLSDARNAGMKAAKGRYISFLDGDDLMNGEKLDKVKRDLIANNFPELFICNMLNLQNNSIFCKDPFEEKVLNQKDIYALISSFIIKYNYIPWAAYQSVYRRDFLEENCLSFKKGLIGAEDCDFFMQVSMYCKTFIIRNICLVIYRMDREGSIMSNVKYSAVIGQLKTFSYWWRYLKQKKNSYQIIQSFFSNRYLGTIMLIANIEGNELDDCVKNIKNNSDIISSANKSIKNNFARLLWKLLGYKKGSQILLKCYRMVK